MRGLEGQGGRGDGKVVVADGCGAGEGRTRGKEAAVMAALEREERGVREGRGAREKRGGREGVGE